MLLLYVLIDLWVFDFLVCIQIQSIDLRCLFSKESYSLVIEDKIFFLSKVVAYFTNTNHLLARVSICLFKEVIHCRIYQLVKSQWKWEDCFALLLLPWRVSLLIDLYSCLDLLILLPATLWLAFLLFNFFYLRSILIIYCLLIYIF